MCNLASFFNLLTFYSPTYRTRRPSPGPTVAVPYNTVRVAVVPANHRVNELCAPFSGELSRKDEVAIGREGKENTRQRNLEERSVLRYGMLLLRYSYVFYFRLSTERQPSVSPISVYIWFILVIVEPISKRWLSSSNVFYE